jgi:hypothetical protein
MRPSKKLPAVMQNMTALPNLITGLIRQQGWHYLSRRLTRGSSYAIITSVVWCKEAL